MARESAQALCDEALAGTSPTHARATAERIDAMLGAPDITPGDRGALLAARAEGLGCVLTTLLCQEEPAVRELLAIPDPWYTAAAIPIGYPVGGGHGPIRRHPPERMAYADTWGEAYARGD